MNGKSRLNGHVGNGRVGNDHLTPDAEPANAKQGWTCPFCEHTYPRTDHCSKKKCLRLLAEAQGRKTKTRPVTPKIETATPVTSYAMVELQVMSAIITALAQLRPAERRRALAWASEVIREMK